MRRLSSSITSSAIRVIAITSLVLSFTYGQQSPHGAIKIACINCHTTEGWKELAKPMKFDHTTTGFTLQGAHTNAQCIQCHTTKRFTGTPTDCFTCHTKDFAKALVPNHQLGKFSHECLSCHTMTGWKPSVFQHSKTNFQLVGAHLSVDCASCHSNNRYSGLSQDCYSCHQKVFGQTTSPNHKMGQFSHDCLTCHTINGWKPATFDHNKTNFKLVGAHAGAECSSCHTGGKFKSLPMDCFSCHNQDFNKTTQPNHTTAQMSHDCVTCHTNISWKPSSFDHNKTNFQLVGAHTGAECSSCHSNGKFKGLPTDCYTCHEKDYLKAITPNHSIEPFSHECLSCHTNIAWKPSTLDHNKTNFQLVGSHKTVECSSCHTNGRFKGLPTDCYSCHQQSFVKTTTPNHSLAQFTHDCLSCHSSVGWKPSTFDHNKTNFQIVGAHKTVDCSSCHTNGRFKGLPSDCFSCHQNNYNSTINPNHTTGQFSHDCLTCHSNLAWKPSTFNHSATTFPLMGAHVSVICTDCHKSGPYKGTSTVCYDCHVTAFNSTTTPNHVTSQFSHDCLTCHSNVAWKPSTFNHNTTAFPLVGAHVSATCASCHTNGVFKGLPSDCFSCHQNNFNSTISPNHATGQFSHNCLTCHSNVAWKPSTFNHSTTAFPLVGAHVSVICSDCHKSGPYKGTSTVCYDCHVTAFNSTTTPSHVTSQFSHDCLTCHSNVAWKPATFNHNTTAFPLVGAHVSVTCVSCHTNGVFKGLPSDCFSCHQNNFNGTTNPNHAAAQFTHDCLTCHSTVVWKPSTFNHSSTTFPLVGAHVSVVCASCHTNGVFKGLPSDCFSCHQNNFNNTTNPNHATSQFSHDCLTCHSTTAWKPSTFNHANTSFPLVGAHAAVICSDCHKNGQYKGTTTDCYTCHLVDFNGTTTPSHVISQFSHTCLICHSNVAWKPATFNHSTTAFPLVGAHVSAACVNCHKNGLYKGTTTDCYTCHLADYNSTTDPNHVSGQYNISKTCITCHNTNAWQPWIFGHDTFYKVSKHHNSSVKCASCHTVPGNLGFASCTTGCHSNAHNKNQTCYTSNCHGGSKN